MTALSIRYVTARCKECGRCKSQEIRKPFPLSKMAKEPTGCRSKTARMRGGKKEECGQSQGQMGELARTWHPLHVSARMCATHNSGNYLSRRAHAGLGSIGDRGVCVGRRGEGGQSNSNIIIVLCVSKSRGQLSVSCY